MFLKGKRLGLKILLEKIPYFSNFFEFTYLILNKFHFQHETFLFTKVSAIPRILNDENACLVAILSPRVHPRHFWLWWSRRSRTQRWSFWSVPPFCRWSYRWSCLARANTLTPSWLWFFWVEFLCFVLFFRK